MRLSATPVMVPLGDLTMLHAMARTVKGVNQTGKDMLARMQSFIDGAWQDTDRRAMNTYTLTVTVRIEADHLFPAIMRVENALKGVGQSWIEWDRHDPQSIADFESARALLAPADDYGTDADFDIYVGEREIRGES
jgi:hypothetical protein